jgi:hypothetical protein
MPRKVVAEIFVRLAIGKVASQQAFNRFRNFRSRAAKSNRPRNLLIQTERPAQAEVISVLHVAIHLDFLAFDPDVGDPVLSTTIGTSSDVQF